MNKKESILILDNSIAMTGALKAIIATSESLRMYNRFIFVVPSNSSAISYIKKKSFQVYGIPFRELSKRPLDIITYLPVLIINTFRINHIIKTKRVRLLHVNDFYNMLGVSTLVLNPQIKLITHIRILPDRYPLILRKLWLMIADTFSSSVLCMSKAIKKQLNLNTKAQVFYDMPLKTEELPPPSQDSSPLSEIKLLYLGNYIKGKGQDYALEAFRCAYRKCQDLRLSFVGGDMGLQKNKEFKESLQRKALEWEITDVVEFNDFSSNIEKEIKDADIVLNFSESESFSLTCLEALYYGTPLIASDCGGPSELFKHKCSGYLVKNRDIDSMVEAIVFLAQSPGERWKYSVESRKYVRENFSEFESSQKLQSIYESAIV